MKPLKMDALTRSGCVGCLRSICCSQLRENELWLGIDATSIERPESKTSPDRTVVYKPNLPQSSKPISYGWQFSTVVVLPEATQ